MNKHIVAYPSEKCPLPSLFISHFLFWLEVGTSRFVVLMVACSFQWIWKIFTAFFPKSLYPSVCVCLDFIIIWWYMFGRVNPCVLTKLIWVGFGFNKLNFDCFNCLSKQQSNYWVSYYLLLCVCVSCAASMPIIYFIGDSRISWNWFRII